MLLLRLPSRMFRQWRKCNCEANVVVIAKKAAAATVPGLTLAVKTSVAYCRWQQYWQLFAQNPAKVRNCIATAISVTTAHFNRNSYCVCVCTYSIRCICKIDWYGAIANATAYFLPLPLRKQSYQLRPYMLNSFFWIRIDLMWEHLPSRVSQGLWLMSPVGWLPKTGSAPCPAQRS